MQIPLLPLRSDHIYMKNAHSAESIKITFSDFYLLSYSRFYLLVCCLNFQVCLKFHSKLTKFTGKMHIDLKRIFEFRSCFFMRLLVFEIWSIIHMVDFHVIRVKYIKLDHISETKSRQKNKLISLKIRFRELRIFSKNVATYEQKKYIFW